MFERIFGKIKKEPEKATASETSKINFRELARLLDERSEEFSRPIIKKSEEIRSEIQNSLSSLKKNLEILEKTKYPEDIDPRIESIVSGNRTSLISRLQSMTSSFNLPTKIDINTLPEFYERCIEIFNETSNKSVRNFKIVKRVFDREASVILQDLKNLDKQFAELRKMISDFENSSLSIIKNDFEDFLKRYKMISEMENEIIALQKKTKELKEEEESVTKELDKLTNSKEFIEFSTLIDTEKKIEGDIKGLNFEIIQTLSPIEKSFKKFKRITSDSKLVKMTDFYLNSPLDALLPNNNLENTRMILNEIRKMIESGEVELDQKKKEKTLEIIKDISHGKVLEKSIENLKKLKKDKEIVETRLDKIKVLDKKNEIEKALSDLKLEIIKNEETVANRKERINKFKKDNEGKKRKLEAMLENTVGKKIEISFN